MVPIKFLNVNFCSSHYNEPVHMGRAGDKSMYKNLISLGRVFFGS